MGARQGSVKSDLNEVIYIGNLEVGVTSTISEKGNESGSATVISTGKGLPPMTEGALKDLANSGLAILKGLDDEAEFEWKARKVRSDEGVNVPHPLGARRFTAKVSTPSLSIAIEWWQEDKDGVLTGRFLPFCTVTRPTGGTRGRAASTPETTAGLFA